MRSKIIVIAELAIALTLTVIVAATLRVHGNQQTIFNKQIPVVVKQLPLVEGGLPVEVRCGLAHLTAPDTLESFSCMAINNTTKNIASLAAVYTVVTEGGEEDESSITSLLTVDSLVHPDIRSARGLKMIQPGVMHPLQPPGPTSYEGENVARVELSIDYVEFEDGTTLGPDKHGSRAVKSTREGAAQYKTWLVQKYQLVKGNLDVITSMLEEPDLPAELQRGNNGNFTSGARRYRNFLRDAYQQRGVAELKKHLER
jgi:hypothetical protein